MPLIAWRRPGLERIILKALAFVLNLFFNLDSIRVAVNDYPEHLDGYFTREQSTYIHSKWASRPHGHTRRYHSSAFYTSHLDFVPGLVLQVVDHLKIELKDLRFDLGVPLTAGDACWSFSILTPSLRILRITVIPEYFDETMLVKDGSYGSSLLLGLKGLPRLADLALTLDHGLLILKYEAFLLRVRRMAEQTFRSISGASELRRFALEGEWAMSEASLVRFVGEHASSLRCLILYGSVLDSD
jgi:hypothetical protein